MTSRRAFLRGLAASGLAASGLASLPGCRAAPRRPRAGSAAPHHVVRVTLDGGFDSVLTVDPKLASRRPLAASGIDLLYREDDCVRGELRTFGPLIGGLARHDARLCLVHGVRHDTVAHDTGEGILRAGKKRYSGASRPFGDVVAELLPGKAPIGHLHLQTGAPEPFSEEPDLMLLPGNPAFRALPMAGEVEIDAGTIARLYAGDDRSSFALPPWFDALQELQRDEARASFGEGSDAFAAAQATLAQARHVSRLLASAERVPSLSNSPLGPGLALALHAIVGDHARFITVRSPRTWLDTHTDNLALQRARLLPILDDLAAFLDELSARRDAHGSLLARTTLVIASELGRFPKLNVVEGKDHWPETSWILAGRGVRPGVTVGATDEQFRGVEVDYRSGQRGGPEQRPIDADALFATVLRVAGGDPVQHGYERDSVLECAVI